MAATRRPADDRCYTSEHHLEVTVPTKHPRINVTKDPELAAAIARARPLLNGAAEARVLHDRAIRGAEALVADAARRQEALEDLLAWSLGDDMDREVLKNIDELAWRHPPEAV
jgi:hypothetical protein